MGIESTSSMVRIEPHALFPLGTDALPVDMGYTPGGDAAYIVNPEWGIDLGIVLMWHLPYLLAPVVLALLAWVAVRVRRLWRQRSFERGQPHCSGCGYLVVGLKSGECPECGQTLSASGIVTARPVGRRIAAWAVSGVALLIVYLVIWMPPVRYAYRWSGPTWMAAGIGEWAQAHDLEYLLQFERSRSRIVRVDWRDGEHRKPIHTEDWRWVSSMWVDDSGELLFLRDYWGGVTVHRWPDFEVVRRFWGSEPSIASDFAVDLERKEVTMARRDGTLETAAAVGYRTPPQVSAKLDQFFDFTGVAWGQPVPAEDRVWLMINDDGTVLGMHRWSHFKRWRRETGELLNEFRIGSGGANWIAGSASENDPRIFASTYDETLGKAGPVEVWDVETGTMLETFDGPGGEKLGLIDISPGGRYFYAAAYETEAPVVWVRDLTTGRWVAELDTSSAGVPGLMRLSTDGDEAVVIGYDADTGFTLMRFDLRDYADPVPPDDER